MSHQYINASEDRTPFQGEAFMTTHLGSTHSSPASFDDDSNINMMVNSTNWQQHIPPPSLSNAPVSAAGSSATSSVATKSTLPMQKRRRVTRACDECRRKKIKCDGKQPCTHCTVYSYECTYDQPSNRRRNPAPQYIEALETRLQRTEALLKAILPDLDVNHPDFDPSKIFPEIQAAATAQAAKLSSPEGSPQASDGMTMDKDPLLDSMVEATGRLDIDETGHMDFHGHSSGLTYLAHLNSQFGGLLGEVKLGSTSWPVAKAARDSSQSSSQSPQGENIPDVTLLPPRENAKFLVDTCLDKACVLMRFIHRPSFITMAKRLYDIRPEDYEEEENTFLPLFYLALGVGCLFVDDAQVELNNTANEASMKYFNAGRRMIEMTDIRDIYSLQAVLLMTIYLQSSTRMSTCYSYIEIALSAAVRMGLHRAVPEARFDPIEREVRKRIFWTCWKMDTYVGAILGLPKGIAPEDIDQEMPVEVDDENITKDTIIEQPENTVSTMAAANAHTKLLMIMAKTVKYIYPIKGVEASVTGKGSGYSVSQTKLHEIEMDLGRWLDSLPMILKPGGDTPREFLKCQYFLKMSFAHVQMMLYRPFVHYISRPKTKGYDERPYAIASACVNVARKIVHTTEEMRKNGLLNGAYWFTIYTTFFSIITLVYYVLVNPPDATTMSILEDAIIGKDCLCSIKEKSSAARRCTVALAPLFDKMSEKISTNPLRLDAPKKKRPRAISHTNPATEVSASPTIKSQSSPGTMSPSDSAIHSAANSPTHRSKTSPISPTDSYRHLSSPPNNFGNKFAPAPDTANRRSPYEVYRTVDFGSQKQEGGGGGHQQQQQLIAYQTHLSSSELPDLNSIMFPSQDLFSFVPHNMDPVVQQQYHKAASTSQLNSPSFPSTANGNPFGSLEGNILGPLPPYLLQGQQQMMGDDGLGQTEQSQGQRMDTTGGSQQGPIPGQYFMGNGGGDAMVPDFFRDEWDDVLMQQSFRT